MFFHHHTSALLLALALLLTLALPLPGAAQDTLDRANISLRIGATYRNGATEFGKTSGGKTVAVGETASMTVKAALLPNGGLMTSYSGSPDGAGGVSGGIVPPPPPPSLAGTLTPAPSRTPADYAWTLDVRLVSLSPTAVTFDARWVRTDASGRHEGDPRKISLRPDERHLLDVLPLEDKSISNLFVELEASRVEDPTFANLGIIYELWLVHETADGQKITRPLRGCSSGTPAIGGHQGEAVTFDFDPIIFPIDANQAVDGTHGIVSLRVHGQITGRARRDNTMELVVRAQRTIHPRSRTTDTPRGGYGDGEKVFVVRPDETTSMEFPLPSGGFSWNAGTDKPAALRPGVAILPNGSVSVSQPAFFAGSKTSLIIKQRALYGGIVEK